MARDPKQLALTEKKSQLSNINFLKLAEWIRQQTLTDTTKQALADAATKELLFRVTQHNIAGVLHATGLTITSTLTPEQQAAEELRQAKESIRVIATVLADTMKELGLQIPPHLTAICEG